MNFCSCKDRKTPAADPFTQPRLRNPVKTKRSFPTKAASTKLLFPAIRNFEKGRPHRLAMGCGPKPAGGHALQSLPRLNGSENRMGTIRLTDLQTDPPVPPPERFLANKS
jgi:hypothetical protein